MRFEVQDIREINLQKSTAVISGKFYIEIKYNSEIKELIRQTNAFLRSEKKNERGAYQKYKSLLKIELNFHRDFNLTLDLE